MPSAIVFLLARSYREEKVSRSAGAGMRILSWSSLWLLLCFLAAGILGDAAPSASASPAAPTTTALNSEQAYAELDSFLLAN
jgi:hypothetical protein